jgi:hypothetical protein
VIWQLNNSTKYSATATLATDRDGRDVWITVIKAAFDIARNGFTTRCDEQVPIVLAPVFAGDPSRSSLLCDSDIDYAKCGVDVLVQGTARDPSDTPVRELMVELDVDNRQKRLRVHGERAWRKGGRSVVPTAAQSFVELPLVYEHAFGGFDPRDETNCHEPNPAGCGHAKNPSDLIDRPAPRIEYADRPLGDADPIPAGFGPIARHWLARRRYAGTYDAAWLEDRMPLLPADFDERFFLAAPEDQQFAQLPPQARIRVAGMGQGVLDFRLPRVAFGVNVQAESRSQHRHPRLRSVQVLPDSRKVVLTYADAMVCTGWKFRISDTEVIEKTFIQ